MIKNFVLNSSVASMISLFLVLFIIGGIAGVLNYRKITKMLIDCLKFWKKMQDIFRK